MTIFTEVSISPLVADNNLEISQPLATKRTVLQILHELPHEYLGTADEVVKTIKARLEAGVLDERKPGIESTGGILSAPFNAFGALTTEEATYAILEIEKYHIRFLKNKNILSKLLSTEDLQKEQDLIATLALVKGAQAPLTNSKTARVILSNIHEFGKTLLGHKRKHDKTEIPDMYDIRKQGFVGSSQERLDQLRREVGVAAGEFYQRLKPTEPVSKEKLLDLLDQKDMKTFKRLLGIRQDINPTMAIMSDIIATLHPGFKRNFSV